MSQDLINEIITASQNMNELTYSKYQTNSEAHTAVQYMRKREHNRQQ